MPGFLRSRNHKRFIESAMDDAVRDQPILRAPLTDPEVRQWMRDFYAYLEWSYHGNQGSPSEMNYVDLVGFLAGLVQMDIFDEDMDLPQIQDLFIRRDALARRVQRMIADFDADPRSVGVWRECPEIPGLFYSGPFQTYYDDEEGEYVLIHGNAFGSGVVGWCETLDEAKERAYRRGH